MLAKRCYERLSSYLFPLMSSITMIKRNLKLLLTAQQSETKLNHRFLGKSLLSGRQALVNGIHRAPTAPSSEASSSPNPGQPVPIGFKARVGTKWSEVETLWSTADSGEGSKRFEFLFRHWANPRPPTNL